MAILCQLWRETSLLMQLDRLARQAALPGAILDAHEKPVLMVGFDFRIIAANQAFRRLVPEAEPIVGRACYEISHGRSEPCSKSGRSCPLRAVRIGNEPVREVHRHRTAVGNRQFEIESRSVSSLDRGRPEGALMVLSPTASASRKIVPNALVGSASVTRRLRDRLERVAPTELPILLIGEPGTRKESIAQAIHQMSTRASAAFDRVGCPEVDGSDPLCEIFGYWRRRADAGWERRPGRIEACRGGTLLISDIESFPQEVLSGLARLARRGVFRTRGDLDWSEGDVRLIFSTSGTNGHGWADSPLGSEPSLAMAVFPIEIPPLRARLEDLEEIVGRMAAADPALEHLQLDPAAWVRLREHQLSGNVRELEAIVRRASLLAGAGVIRPCHLPEISEAGSCETPPVRPAEGVVSLAEIEERYLVWADRVSRGSRSDLARQLGLSERALYRRLRRIRGSRRGPTSRRVERD